MNDKINGELAPRDVVSQAIVFKWKRNDTLASIDLAHLNASYVTDVSQGLHGLEKFGINITSDRIPVRLGAIT